MLCVCVSLATLKTEWPSDRGLHRRLTGWYIYSKKIGIFRRATYLFVMAHADVEWKSLNRQRRGEEETSNVDHDFMRKVAAENFDCLWLYWHLCSAFYRTALQFFILHDDVIIIIPEEAGAWWYFYVRTMFTPIIYQEIHKHNDTTNWGSASASVHSETDWINMEYD